MTRRASLTVIGGFVVGALALLVVAIYLFAGLGVFHERVRWVTYFQGSVTGLIVGAPVNFRGVQIGSVSEIMIELDQRTLEARIPVYFIVEVDRARWLDGSPAMPSPDVLVGQGLRARLVLQSIVTGMTMIDLDFVPDSPAILVGRDPSVPEVPSLPSEFEQLRSLLTRMPIEEMLDTLTHTMNSVDRLASSPDLARALAGLAGALQEVPPALAETRQTLAQAREAIAEVSRLARSAEGQMAGTNRDLRATLKAAERTLKHAESTLAAADDLVGPGSGPREDLERALRNLSEASTSLRGFARELDRNPNALLLGKGR